MTTFALRNWQPGASGTLVRDLTPEDLVTLCNCAVTDGTELIAGYAPFCRHVFLRNTSPTRCSFAPVDDGNRHLLRSGYRSRREGEFAVLERWFEGLEAPVATHLDVIVYSHKQLLIEAAAFPDGQEVPECDWGIVGIIGTLAAFEPPMPPITQMRNALGPSEGGSGIPLDPDRYAQSVLFWDQHAAVK
ncbi:MAG: DUF3228 family protein [Hyphomicrobiaceae bacterium]